MLGIFVKSCLCCGICGHFCGAFLQLAVIVVTGVYRYGTADGRKCAEVDSVEVGLPMEIVDF